jgi:hypothetical protein
MPRVDDCVLHNDDKTTKVGTRRTTERWRQCGGGDAGVIGEELKEKWILGFKFFSTNGAVYDSRDGLGQG